MLTFVSIAAALTYLFIAYGDLREREIGNEFVVVLAAFAVFKLVLATDVVDIGYTVAATTTLSAVLLLMFWRGVMGGGDVKLIAASALFVGHQDLVSFLVLTTLVGGVLALICLAERTTGRYLGFNPGLAAEGPGINREEVSTAGEGAVAVEPVRTTVPYGVAIAAAGIWFAILQAPLGVN